MSLIGADLGMILIEGIAFFFISGNYVFKHSPVKGVSAADPGYKFIHIRPAVFVESNTCKLGFMSEYEGDKLSDFFLCIRLFADLL